ncbi:hypothetical protein PIB30_038930 [Stylosanthes scabra]|uniref:Uncharacterized protein n=1 Tax=Stylosanthes scabra TaxID=79078 RepID=A0ABU6SEB2_9FABA|nr:hypothetical protein [Stylosanthes scabra]
MSVAGNLEYLGSDTRMSCPNPLSDLLILRIRLDADIHRGSADLIRSMCNPTTIFESFNGGLGRSVNDIGTNPFRPSVALRNRQLRSSTHFNT